MGTGLRGYEAKRAGPPDGKAADAVSSGTARKTAANLTELFPAPGGAASRSPPSGSRRRAGPEAAAPRLRSRDRRPLRAPAARSHDGGARETRPIPVYF